MNQASRRLGLLVTGLVGLMAVGCGNNGGSPDSGVDVAADQTTGDAPDQTATTGSSLVLDKASLTVVEGDALGGTFMVSLGKPFPTPITVSVITSDRTVASVAQDTLVFPANDVGPQLVTVFGTPDDDTESNSTIVTLSSVETGSATVHVTVTDVNKQAIVVSPTQIFMQQGGTTQAGIRLAFRPAAPVTITVVSPDPTVLTVTPATLTFAADSTYSIAQQVTLTALAGASVGDKALNLSISATSVDTVLPVPVVISDPNTLGLLVTPGSLSLVEGGTPGTVMVSLTKAPPTDIAVSVSSTNNAQALPSPVGLTFTASNFSTPQPVTITPQANNDPKDETATITFSVTTAVVPAVAPRTVSVLVKTDQNQSIQVLPAAVTVNPGSTTTFDVWMAFNPGSAISVNAFSSNPARVTVTPSTLIFNATNFGTHQAVTVQGVTADDLADVMANITLTSVAANSVNVPVTVKNTNSQALQVVYGTAPGTIVMQETQAGGVASSTSFGVSLAYNPAANVSVTLTVSDTFRLTTSKSTLTFTPTNAKTAQFVTLTSVHDLDLVDDNLTLTVSAPGLPSVAVPIIILDTDVERVTVTKGGSPITSIDDAVEGVATSFNLGLTLMPPVAVTVSLTSSDPSRATVPASVSLPTTAAVTVPVTLLTDQDAKANVVTITMHVADATLNIADRTVTINIADTNIQAVLVGTTSTLGYPSAAVALTVHEASAPNSAPFFVALNAKPDATTSVQISISPPAADGIAVNPPSLMFTTDNWMVAQMVTVSGVGDANLSTDLFSIRVSAPTLSVSDQFVNVTELDDDVQGLVVSSTTLGSLAEGMTGSFKVHLTKQPPTMTTVTVTVPPDVTDSFGISPTVLTSGDGTSSLSLTFSPSPGGTSGYDVDQTVYVKAKADTNTNDETALINVALPSFAGSQNVSVQSSDVNQQAILVIDPMTSVAPANVTLTENKQNAESSTSTRTFNVTLKFPPHGSPPPIENITVASSNTLKVLVTQPSSATLSFSGTKDVTGGWNLTQTFAITSVADNDTNDESVTITVSTGLVGGAWKATNVTFPVTVSDLDVGIVVTPSTGASVKEDGSNPATFNVSLSKNPTGNVTVAIGNSDSSRALVSPSTLMFTPTNGTTSKMFTVTGQMDSDTVDNAVTITLSSTDLTSFQTKTVPVTVTEM